MFVLKFNFDYLPSAPVNVEGVGVNNSVHLTWEPPELPGVSDILGYKIYRDLSPLTTLGSITEYNDTDVINLRTYYYRISALNTLGEGALSVEKSVTPMPIPTPPRNLQALAGNNFVNLFWDPPISDGGSMILRYNIYRGNGSGNETYFNNVTRTTFLYNDTSVINGETYYYFVKAENTYSESLPSQELEMTPEGPPSQPLGLQANASSGYILLSWQPPANNGGFPIYGYVVYRGENSTNLTFLVIVGELNTYYNDTSVTNGVEYFYYVVAFNDLGESPSSNLVNATPYGIPEPPEKPQGKPGLGYINITWEEPIFDGGKPIIEYKIYKYQVNSFELLVILNNSTYSYQDKNVSSSYSYRYKITSVNAFGESKASELFGLSPLGPPFPPQQIYIDEDYGLLDIGWVPPVHDGGKPITRYRIYRGTELGEEEFLDSISPFVTNYRDPNVSPDVTYYYYITAVNELGESEPSSTVSGMPWAEFSVSTPPLDLQASAGNGYINLSWSLPLDDGGAAITGYNIYRGTSPGNEVRLGYVSTHYKKFRDRNVINGLTYYYYIRAVNHIGESERTDRVSATPLDTQEVNNSGDTDGLDLTLLMAWLIMILVIFFILLMLIRNRRVHQKNSIGKKIQKPDSTELDKDKQTADSPIPPVDDSMHRLRERNIDGPERFG
jgi:fibronectin type 3 domain-containing protein